VVSTDTVAMLATSLGSMPGSVTASPPAASVITCPEASIAVPAEMLSAAWLAVAVTLNPSATPQECSPAITA